MIPLFKVFMADTAPKEVEKILLSGYVGQGPKVEEFEKQLKAQFNNDYVLAVNSCTSALQLAIHLIKPEEGWGSRDEIIVTPLTCFATISAILACGAKIRWADIDPETCNIDLRNVEWKLNSHTRAVLVVHWAGYPVDLDQIWKLKSKYQNTFHQKLDVIEDCAHCWDASCNVNLVGSHRYQIGNSENLSCFSFQAIKFLTTGDGGLLCCPDAETYRRAKLLRWFGLDRDAGASFRCIQDIAESGFKYHMNDIAAAIGIENLKHMDVNTKIHKDNAEFYYNELNNCPGVTLLKRDPHISGSYWIFTMKVENRDRFVKHMEANGVMTSPVHARCDKHSCVEKYKTLLPDMDDLDHKHISIPCGWWVSKDDRKHIVDCIKKGW